MIHSMYTRQRYADEEELAYRMELAAKTSIPSMVDSAGLAPHPVRWVWAVLERDKARVSDTLLEAGWQGSIVLQDSWPPAQLLDDHISSTLDSDDRVASFYLTKMQKRWKPGPTFVVTWQPIKQRLEDGELFQHRMTYATNRPSPFYAVYNPSEECYVYARSHGQMHLCGAPVELARERIRGAIAVIHDRNKLMDLRKGDTPLRRKKPVASKPRPRPRRGRGR